MAKIIKKVPAVKTFDLPAGQYKATLTSTKLLKKQTRKGPQDWIRLVYAVKIDSMADQLPCAGRNFVLDLNPGSDLRVFLENWLGLDFFKSMSNKDLDFDGLVGLDGDIELSHYCGEDYEKPLVVIDGIYPKGSLKLTEQALKPVGPAFKS